MPVFNGGKYLEHSVRSILAQTFENWKLLIIDDGSTDDSVKSLSGTIDKRIEIISEVENLGLSLRLNQAVEMCRSKYFGRMDHDDICHPTRFAKQIDFLEKHPDVDLLATKCLTIDDSWTILGELPFNVLHRDICRYPWIGFYLPHPTWIGRSTWFKKHPYKYPAPYRCEDQELLLRTFETSNFHTLPEHLLAYRLSDRIHFKSRLQTRFSLMKVQRDKFSNDKSWINFVLADSVGLMRIGVDIVSDWKKRFWSRASSRTAPISEFDNSLNWPEILASYQR